MGSGFCWQTCRLNILNANTMTMTNIEYLNPWTWRMLSRNAAWRGRGKWESHLPRLKYHKLDDNVFILNCDDNDNSFIKWFFPKSNVGLFVGIVFVNGYAILAFTSHIRMYAVCMLEAKLWVFQWSYEACNIFQILLVKETVTISYIWTGDMAIYWNIVHRYSTNVGTFGSTQLTSTHFFRFRFRLNSPQLTFPDSNSDSTHLDSLFPIQISTRFTSTHFSRFKSRLDSPQLTLLKSELNWGELNRKWVEICVCIYLLYYSNFLTTPTLTTTTSSTYYMVYNIIESIIPTILKFFVPRIQLSYSVIGSQL